MRSNSTCHHVFFVCVSHPTHIRTHKSTYTLTNQTKLKSILMDLIWLKVSGQLLYGPVLVILFLTCKPRTGCPRVRCRSGRTGDRADTPPPGCNGGRGSATGRPCLTTAARVGRPCTAGRWGRESRWSSRQGRAGRRNQPAGTGQMSLGNQTM